MVYHEINRAYSGCGEMALCTIRSPSILSNTTTDYSYGFCDVALQCFMVFLP